MVVVDVVFVADRLVRMIHPPAGSLARPSTRPPAYPQTHPVPLLPALSGEVTVTKAADGRKETHHRGYFFGSLDDTSEEGGAEDTVTASSACVFAFLPKPDEPAAGPAAPQHLLDYFRTLSDACAPLKESLSLTDLEHVTDLGGGGYGTVLLMRSKRDNSAIAVKVLLRRAIVKRKQAQGNFIRIKWLFHSIVTMRHPSLDPVPLTTTNTCHQRRCRIHHSCRRRFCCGHSGSRSMLCGHSACRE